MCLLPRDANHSIDGEDVAYNLDLAVHHTLITGKDFQEELIPRRAEALAKSLSKKLEPLFTLQNPVEQWKLNILKEWQGQRHVLQRIFESALKVKTMALVTKDTFEVIFPATGHVYDPEHTELERNNHCAEANQPPLVRVCLVPGLRKFANDRKVVDYNSFRRPSDDRLEIGDIVASPLVIPEY